MNQEETGAVGSWVLLHEGYRVRQYIELSDPKSADFDVLLSFNVVPT